MYAWYVLKNGRGLSPLPSITPSITCLGWEVKPFTCATWFRSERYGVNHEGTVPVVPWDLILFISLRWDTLPNTFTTSKQTTITDFTALAALVIVFRHSVIRVAQDFFWRLALRSLWSARHVVGYFTIKRLMILEKIGYGWSAYNWLGQIVCFPYLFVL